MGYEVSIGLCMILAAGWKIKLYSHKKQARHKLYISLRLIYVSASL